MYDKMGRPREFLPDHVGILVKFRSFIFLLPFLSFSIYKPIYFSCFFFYLSNLAYTQMTKISLESIDPIFSDLNQCLTALTNQKYPEVIESSTRGFNRLMRTHVLAFLHSRSVAYEKQGLLTRALEDAERMIQYVPDIACGYLRAGLVYTAHGKPKDALKIYAQGIKVANPDEYNNEYKQLHVEKEKAIERSNQYVDIVAHLPQELLGKILDDLDPGRIWVCLKVSKIWCDKVSRCGTVWWNRVVITHTDDDKMDQAICDALPLVKNYVHDLKFLNPWSTNLNSRYLDYLKNGVFENVKALTLKGLYFKRGRYK